MKKQLLLAFAFFPAYGYTQTLEWVKPFGFDHLVDARAIFTDDSSNVYTTGMFYDTADFDPGPGVWELVSTGTWDFFVTKMNAAGNLVWAKDFGGTNINNGSDVFVDQHHNVYVTGGFTGITDFDPGPGVFSMDAGSTSQGNVYVLKLDVSGNLVWVKEFECPLSADHGTAIQVDSLGNVYTTGYFVGECDFDPGPGVYELETEGSYEIFISKLDSAGNFVWAKRIGSPAQQQALGMAVEPNGNFFICGYFDGTVDFDPGPGTYMLTSAGGLGDMFVGRYSSAGNLLWARAITNAGTNAANGVAFDRKKNVIISGLFEGTLDFNPGIGTYNLTATGSQDAFVSKYDSAGNFIWARAFQTDSISNALEVTTDTMNNIYVNGYFGGTIDLDPGVGVKNHITYGGNDAFLVALDENGHYRWAIQTGGVQNDIMNDTYISQDGYVYSTGVFAGTVDFDAGPGVFNLTAGPFRSSFVQKLHQCFPMYLSVTNTGTTLTVAEAGAAYQWLDCNNAFAGISGETGQDFTATINGNYAAQVSESGCTDTTACFLVTNAGLNEIQEGKTVRVYPNITSGNVFIECSHHNSGKVCQVMTTTGAIVFQKNLEQAFTSLDLSGFQRGLYLLKIGEDVFRIIRE